MSSPFSSPSLFPSSSVSLPKPTIRTYGKSRRPAAPVISISRTLTDDGEDDEGYTRRAWEGDGGLPGLTRSSSAGSGMGASSSVYTGDDGEVEDDASLARGSGDSDMDSRVSVDELGKASKSAPASRSIAPLPRARTSSLTTSSIAKPSSTSSAASSSSSQSTLKSFFAPKPRTISKPAGNLSPFASTAPGPPAPTAPTPMRVESSTQTKPAAYRQLHFRPSPNPLQSSNTSTTNSNLTTCKHCHLTYLRSPGDSSAEEEKIHRAHCERVMLGSVWEDRKGRGEGRVVLEGVEVGRKGKGGSRGWKGVGRVLKIEGSSLDEKSQVHDILSSVDTILSAPPLPPSSLSSSSIYLFLSSSPAPPPISSGSSKRIVSSSLFGVGGKGKGKEKERVVGVVVAEPIRWGMRVVGKGDLDEEEEGMEKDLGKKRKREELVMVGDAAQGELDEGDSGGTLCYPERLPTRLGIHRIFTVPRYRGCGLIKILLDAACEHTIYGYKCDVNKGDVAFSQPTQSGRAVMDAWGGGNVRVFVEDEQEEGDGDGREADDRL